MSSRTHVVLVPGFGGFDALGQIFYYANVTTVYDAWKEKAGSSLASLHYFENLPTAGVRTRAIALRAFLEERVYRDVIRKGDRIALVGHSTGGLDIRQLLVNLDPRFDAVPNVRDPAKKVLVEDHDILNKVERIVFLSVPQKGTNSADFTRQFRTLLDWFFRTVEAELVVSRASVLEVFEKFVLKHLPLYGAPQVFDAVRDTILETLNGGGSTADDRYRAAASRAAFGELLGWLVNVKDDFFAIDDLSYEEPSGALPTPARYPSSLREMEREAWEPRILTRSFATMARPPYEGPPRTKPYDPLWLLPWLANLKPSPARKTDAVFRLVYAATAAGPFEASPEDRIRDSGRLRQVESWENDGIVNTASMLWPDGEATTLVPADHGDIIGHYILSKAIKTSEVLTGRINHSYDILGSGMGFDEHDFKKVWEGVFEFCTS
ncbi:MAG TPA: hypothetical protein VHC69_34620 [Polyangiaceae bacterium]|nr:hypothetical protein [Polyangiaceae bacterium]